MIEAELRTAIIADAAVTAIVGTKMYPIIAPQGVSMPYITYRRVSTERFTEHGSSGGTAIASVEVVCWAASYDAAKELGEAVRAICDGATGSLGNYEVGSIIVQDEADVIEHLAGGVEDPPFGVRIDLDVTFREVA